MARKIGRFEILSELAKADSGCVYKATDPESGQIIALKTLHLDVFGDHAEEVVQRLLQEAETTKDLSSSNITAIYGAGEIDGEFCSAMEYVQGNSIATMLARKEGFSIWDLLDISRQVCQALDLAHQQNVFHFSLEPAKIMVTWDGTVKMLSFGISSTGYVAAHAVGPIPSVLQYMSPEQIGGEMLDARSNLFTWGAILYEMVTDQKPFEGPDADAVRSKILEAMPVPPAQLNSRINEVASTVIMKALSKDPEKRYQSGREMVNDLEKCRENTGRAPAKKAGGPPKGIVAPEKARAAAATKFAGAPPQKQSLPVAPASPEFEVSPVATPHGDHPMAPSLRETETFQADPAHPAHEPEMKKTALPARRAAAAGAGTAAARPAAPQLDPSVASSTVKASVEAAEQDKGVFSPDAAESDTDKPRIAIDPLMADDGGEGRQGASFSDLEELPPLKEVYIAPPAPKPENSAEEQALPSIILRPGSQPEKPKVQPREVAEKAIKEIKSVPPKLLLYSVAGAIALILIIAAALAWHSYTQNTDEEGRVPAPSAAPQNQPAPAETQTLPAEPAPTPVPQAEGPPPAHPEPAAATSTRVAAQSRNKKNAKKVAPAPAIIPGQLSVDSTPQGAQVLVDGRSDPNWITPYNLSDMSPGQHTVVVSKAGYGLETRTVEVASGSKSFLAVHLASLSSSVMVGSDPPGASIYLDGKDTQRVTPSQVTLDRGTHTILVRKAGYLDETTSATAQPGQTYHFSPTLRPLGDADDIRTVGKVRKLFGGKNAQTGMGKVSIKTNPKGAQIAVNRRMLDKTSPVEILLKPGNYIVDITLTGYKPMQKVIVVEQDGSVSLDETLSPQ
ncbi:MAG TPA: serine/threonine-protein kinase [Terriglobales bacterium]|nr:serine/threonine-protein kinase [Terriglobales bacterium]